MPQRLATDGRSGQLPSLGPARLSTIVAAAARDRAEWSDLVRYDPASRWYHLLERAEDHEVWLLSWLPGQQTGFHDHGASSGAFAVTLGALSERGVLAGRPQGSPRTIMAGGVRAFGPDYVHDVRNDAVDPAVSVHAYSPPLASMRRYELAPDGLLRMTAEDRSW
jgi:predicted metal-dependent enzyme (double-stranded beta helix superfamily)